MKSRFMKGCLYSGTAFFIFYLPGLVYVWWDARSETSPVADELRKLQNLRNNKVTLPGQLHPTPRYGLE